MSLEPCTINNRSTNKWYYVLSKNSCSHPCISRQPTGYEWSRLLSAFQQSSVLLSTISRLLLSCLQAPNKGVIYRRRPPDFEPGRLRTWQSGLHTVHLDKGMDRPVKPDRSKQARMVRPHDPVAYIEAPNPDGPARDDLADPSMIATRLSIASGAGYADAALWFGGIGGARRCRKCARRSTPACK